MYRLKGALLLLLAGLALPTFAAGIPVKLYKNPNCGCCNVYSDYLKSNGFEVEAFNTIDMAAVAQKFSVPAALEGCHTAIAGGYVFQGLIPANFVKQVLNEHKPIRGISLPGMPTGAPGMPGVKSGPLNVYYLSDAKTPAVYASF